MKLKFLGLNTPLAFDFSNSKKWRENKKDNTVELIDVDIEKDRLETTATIEVITKKINKEGTQEQADNSKLWIKGVANAAIVDRVDEQLDPRGLILDDYQKNPTLLAHHSYYHPVGQVELITIENDGVFFEAWIGDTSVAELTPMQLEIRSLVKQGILKTVSVGFIPKKIKRASYNDKGEIVEPMVIESWDLLELSIVAVPCNQDSVFTVKQLNEKVTTESILNEIKTSLSVIANGQKRIVELSEGIVKTLSEKAPPVDPPKEDEEDEEEKSKPKDEEEEKAKPKEDDEQEKRFKKLEDSVKQIAEAITVLSKAIAK
jgi:HK97 family phage prohead protease